MKERKVKQLPLGLYRIYWKDGGSSTAAVGMMEDGSRWLAPTNWVYPGHGRRVWKLVKKVLRIWDNTYTPPHTPQTPKIDGCPK
jgi:hypothetical protein